MARWFNGCGGDSKKQWHGSIHIRGSSDLPSRFYQVDGLMRLARLAMDTTGSFKGSCSAQSLTHSGVLCGPECGGGGALLADSSAWTLGCSSVDRHAIWLARIGQAQGGIAWHDW